MSSGGRLIVAEDDAIAALAMEVELSAAGYEVCGIAATGPEAVRLAELHRPDLAVLDAKLANGTCGREAALEIQQRFGIPSIFVSGHLTEAKAQQAGGLGLLQKPYRPEDLTALVGAVLRWRRDGALIEPLPFGLLFSCALGSAHDTNDVLA